MTDLLFMLGAACAVAGVALISLPGALIAAGVLLACAAVLIERGNRRPTGGDA